MTIIEEIVAPKFQMSNLTLFWIQQDHALVFVAITPLLKSIFVYSIFIYWITLALILLSFNYFQNSSFLLFFGVWLNTLVQGSPLLLLG